MSNYVYAGMGAITPPLLAKGFTATNAVFTNAVKFTAKQQVQATSPAQRRAALQRFRPQAIAEFQKQGLGNFVTVTPTGELRLLTPFGAIDDIARACLQMPLPSLSLDFKTGKFTTTSTQVGTQMVDAIPFLSAADKARLKNAPFSFVAGIFDPMIDFVGSVLEDVMDAGMSPAQQSAKTARDTGELGKGGYVYDLTTFPFSLAVVPLQALGVKIPNLKAVNIALEQPGDELFEPVSRRQIKTVRTVLAFFVLFFKKWLELHGRFLAKIKDMAFPEDDTQVHRIDEAGDGTSMAQPRVLERLPSDALGPFSKSVPSSAPTAAENSANRLVWVIPQDNRKNQKRSFVTLSAQGFAARKQALARDFDAKYKAFEKDFNFWHPDYAARCGWLVNVEKKSEREAHDIAAREYELPQKFGALSRGKFAITAGPTLGGGLGGLGNRHSLTGTVAGLSGIGALRDLFENYQHLGVPPDPASTTGEVVAAEGAGLSAGAQLALIIGSTIIGSLAIVGGVVFAVVALSLGFEPKVKVTTDPSTGKTELDLEAKRPPSEGEPPSREPPSSGPPSREPPSRGGAGTQSESASGGFPVVPVALAAGVALLLLSRR